MGYSTDFEGKFKLNKALDDDTYNFLVALSETRRMKRDSEKLKSMGFTGDYGIDGEFFVYGGGACGQEYDESIIEYNKPPRTQPGLWCQWTPTEDRMYIEWDGGEKFYCYTQWLEYIIDNILEPQGYCLNGEVHFQGEDIFDSGYINVEENTVTTTRI